MSQESLKRTVSIISSDDEAESRNTKDSQPKKKVRMVNPAKHWCFTWNNPDWEALSRMSEMDMITKFVCQEETAPSSGTIHAQGYLCFAEKQRPMTVFPEIPAIHWEPCRNPDASIAYCTKLETRKPGGRCILVGVTVKSEIPVIEPKGWQLEVVDKIPTMEPRKIYWYWEPDGNMGKSALCKYLCVKEGALILSGKSSDMKAAIASMKTKPKLIVMDVPRSSTKYISYTGLEEVSNGCFFSGKYEGGMVLMENPVIIVFANERPDYDQMSADRWEVTSLTAAGTVW